ncbi:unnamed protein product, partial [Rotaria sordida]
MTEFNNFQMKFRELVTKSMAKYPR